MDILVGRWLCVSVLLLRCKYGVHDSGAVVLGEVLLELFLDVVDLFFEVHESRRLNLFGLLAFLFSNLI